MNSVLRGDPRGYLSLKEKSSSSISFLSGTKELHRPVAENCAQSLIMAATATGTHGLCTFLAETKCKGIDGIIISWILTHVEPFGVVPPDVKPRS